MDAFDRPSTRSFGFLFGGIFAGVPVLLAVLGLGGSRHVASDGQAGTPTPPQDPVWMSLFSANAIMRLPSRPSRTPKGLISPMMWP